MFLYVKNIVVIKRIFFIFVIILQFELSLCAERKFLYYNSYIHSS